MKKTMCVVAGVLALSVFGSSCGISTGKKGKDFTEVTVWSADSHSKNEMDKLVREFNDTTGKQEGIKLVYEVKENDIAQQIDLALSTGAAPDIFPLGSIKKSADNKYIEPIEKMPGGKEFLKRYEGNLVEGWHLNEGVAYTVPLTTTTVGLIYNKDMFKQANIVDENGEAKPPQTIAEMVEDAKILTNVAEKRFGIIIPMKWSSWFDCDVAAVVMPSVGHQGYDTRTGTYDYSGYKQLLEAILQIKKDGSLYPGAEGIDNDPARARFAEGNIGMKIGYSWDVGVLNTQFPAKCDWGVAPLPTYSTQERCLQPYRPGWAPCINSESVANKDPEKIMTVYKWICGDEVARDLYKSGLNMPWDYNIIADLDPSECELKGWAEFADLLKISTNMVIGKSKNMDGKTTLADMFMNSVWNGDMTVDEALEKATKDANEAVAKYLEINPNYDGSIRVDPDYNIKR